MTPSTALDEEPVAVTTAPAPSEAQTAFRLQAIMRQASRDLLGGFELRADCKPKRDIVRYPARFVDKREIED